VLALAKRVLNLRVVASNSRLSSRSMLHHMCSSKAGWLAPASVPRTTRGDVEMQACRIPVSVNSNGALCLGGWQVLPGNAAGFEAAWRGSSLGNTTGKDRVDGVAQPTSSRTCPKRTSQCISTRAKLRNELFGGAILALLTPCKHHPREVQHT
jgi:hypothetical protein